MEKVQVKEAKGKLGILTIGVGAVATTFMAGTLLTRKGQGVPVGSITQLATMRLGKREENRFPKIKDAVPLADLNDVVFGGWDIFEENKTYINCSEKYFLFLLYLFCITDIKRACARFPFLYQ